MKLYPPIVPGVIAEFNLKISGLFGMAKALWVRKV